MTMKWCVCLALKLFNPSVNDQRIEMIRSLILKIELLITRRHGLRIKNQAQYFLFYLRFLKIISLLMYGLYFTK